MDGFVRLFFACPMAVAAIAEQDKRQRLQDMLANLFVLYMNNWCDFPLTPNVALSAGRLVQGLLASVGFDADSGRPLEGGCVPLVLNPCALASGSTTATATTAIAIVDSIAMPQGSQGLRQGTFAAFIVMHLIRHKDISEPPGALAWSLHTLCTDHGQPIQIVALASLIRTVE